MTRPGAVKTACDDLCVVDATTCNLLLASATPAAGAAPRPRFSHLGAGRTQHHTNAASDMRTTRAGRGRAPHTPTPHHCLVHSWQAAPAIHPPAMVAARQTRATPTAAAGICGMLLLLLSLLRAKAVHAQDGGWATGRSVRTHLVRDSGPQCRPAAVHCCAGSGRSGLRARAQQFGPSTAQTHRCVGRVCWRQQPRPTQRRAAGSPALAPTP